MHPVPFTATNLGGGIHIGTAFAINRLEKYWGNVLPGHHSTYYGHELDRFYDKVTGKPKALYVIHVEDPKTGALTEIVGDTLDMVKWTYREWMADKEAA